ncbi:hypothetical protein [Spongiimicrobium salis]|uniref:hypothetical protein n=1 Tax=Spongiimicrobium salis TaxID=1667022 RepID=UPI00374DE532
MALLKKLKGSTLMETMVATVLIVIIFMMASLLLETIFVSSTQRNTEGITERLQELEYEYKKELIRPPYIEDWKNWEIDMRNERIQGVDYIVLDAQEKNSDRSQVAYLISNE